MASRHSSSEPDQGALSLIASRQRGFFTARQGRRCGFSWGLLSYYAGKGRFNRCSQGIYRFPGYHVSSDDRIFHAWLAVGPEDAIVSHETALGLLGLADPGADNVHLMVRRERRRKPPEGILLHTSLHFPAASEAVSIDGLLVTNAARTLVDVAGAGDPAGHLPEATKRAIQLGLTDSTQLLLLAQQRRGNTQALIRRSLQIFG